MKAQDKGRKAGKDDADGEGREAEEATVMEEDDYATTRARWKGLAKQNLKHVSCYYGSRLGLCRVLMESFTPEQHERYEQYWRSAVNRNTVRKVSTVGSDAGSR